MPAAVDAHPNPAEPLPPSLAIGPGLHWWCSCGRSGHLPFCDGSHKGTGCQPVRLELTATVRLTWSAARHPPAPPPELG